ncbi:MAG: ABC transporter ATP-binding protein [Acidobacteria bacterium]|nr:ABC transporter ATP-binding protein [Acidobacteriota bacterium]
MRPIIRAEGLAKQYRVHGAEPTYRTLRDALSRTAGAPLRLLRRAARRPRRETVWALDGVDFSAQPGEIIGIIGRNGAGKSTMLKVLSRITEPTRGRAALYGRVSSLLEVGTGFHPELSGRENVFLNGAILGMKRAEIARKFDEIVAFSGIDKFIDTPVKWYSSGMYLRLAFSVAAHLEPEILIVDEVLAVGDAAFQKKCLNKMQSVGEGGRTVLFVSHDMNAVTRLCPRAILLDRGKVLRDGAAHEVVSAYLGTDHGASAARAWDDPALAPGNEVARLRAVRVRDEQGRVSPAVDIRRPVGLEIEFEVTEPGHALAPNFHVFNERGVNVFVTNDLDPEWRGRPRPAGIYTSTAWIPGNFLAEGTLIVGAAVSTLDPTRVHFFERDAVAFHVVDSLDGDSARGGYAGPYPGVVRPALRWTTRFEAAGTPPEVGAS